MQQNRIVPRVFYLRNPARKVGVLALQIEIDIAADLGGVIGSAHEDIAVQLHLARFVRIECQNPRPVMRSIPVAERREDIARRIYNLDIPREGRRTVRML